VWAGILKTRAGTALLLSAAFPSAWMSVVDSGRKCLKGKLDHIHEGLSPRIFVPYTLKPRSIVHLKGRQKCTVNRIARKIESDLSHLGVKF
jgi:hypothetical protein